MSNENALTPEQVRAARSLLRWSQHVLAAQAEVAVSTVADFERGQRIPVLNNVLAIRQALEMAGITFIDGGVRHGFQWTFMTEHGMSSLHVTFKPEDASILHGFAAIFGTVTPPKVSINRIQSATLELKGKLSRFVEHYGSLMPHLNRLEKTICDLDDGEYFLILPVAPSSTAEQLQYEQLIHQLNHPNAQTYEAEQNQIFGALLQEYNITIPRTDKHTRIGNAMRKNRKCRFCHRTTKDGAKYKKEAHAIPAALGNQHLKLADECDECNGHFGDNVEPTLIELLNVQRVFLGIKSRGSQPEIEFSKGKMVHNGEQMVVMSTNISEDASGTLVAQLGKAKSIIPLRFYQALSKIALSVIPEDELPSLERTIRWVRYNESLGKLLPKVAVAIVPLPPSLSAEITLYVRKKETSRLPHVVCEFRLGCYMYVYALPFSDKDSWDLIEFFEDGAFKDTFRHYSYVPSWVLQDYSNPNEISVIQNILLNCSKG